MNDWIQEVTFESEDGTRLTAWYGEAPRRARGTVLYFHGNAENAATQKQELNIFCQTLDMNLFMVDYRGFGKSEGTPDEVGLLMDGRAAMRKLNEISNTTPDEVVVFGRSLGGAVATRVATELGAKGLVLHSTFAALDDLVARKYWFVPAKYLLWNHLRAADWIADFNGPLFIAHGAKDALIPITHGERLFENCPSGKKTFVRQDGVSHFDCANRQFYREFSRFLSTLEPSGKK